MMLSTLTGQPCGNLPMLPQVVWIAFNVCGQPGCGPVAEAVALAERSGQRELMDETESAQELDIGGVAPAEAGSYVLIARLDRPVKIAVGRLGTFVFEAGWYAYAGSALGPGGLAARLEHHYRRDKTMQWHIDFLLAHAELVEVWWAVDKKRKECTWAAALRSVPGARVPVPNFGASDCKCLTHLVYFTQPPVFTNFARALSDLEF